MTSQPDVAPAARTWHWDDADLRTFLSNYGRTARHVRVEQLRSWWRNLVLHVWADDEELVIRRYGLTPEPEIAWELEVIALLRAHDFSTIAPLARADGSGQVTQFLGGPTILYPFIPGARLEDPAQWQNA